MPSISDACQRFDSGSQVFSNDGYPFHVVRYLWCPKYPDVKQFIQPHTLLQCQLDQVEVSRSLGHVLRSLCRRREGNHGRRHVFSR